MMAKKPYYQRPPKEVIKELKSDAKNGLSRQEAKKRQEKFGPNEIKDDRPKNIVLTILWHQINSFLIYILLAAAVITYFLDHTIDTYVIVAVIIINTIIGFIQEYKANKAIEALKQMIVSTSKVYRDGELLEIPSEELVPGDLVLIEEGDLISADGRLIEAKNLRTIESSLTGEAFPTKKNTKTLSAKTPRGDQKNSVWMSTHVASGIGKFIVTATGKKTAIGQIAEKLGEIEEEKTHFQLKTDHLAKQMSLIAIGCAVITFFVGFFIRQISLTEIFTFTVASLVSGIPEGLPAVLIIILATGATRMARKNAIIRSLPATETLSIVDVVATDKTGTLTKNTMTAKEIHLPDNFFEVEGDGWKPEGNILKDEQIIDPRQNKHLSKLIIAGGVCSRARVINKGTETEPEYTISGDPTEGASTVLADKAGFKSKLNSIKLIDELPFIQKERFKAVMAEENSQRQIFASGAPESIVERSIKQIKNDKIVDFTDQEKEAVLSQVKTVSSKAMRTIAFGYKKTDPKKRNLSYESVNDLVFLGFIGMFDPPRKGAAEAIIKAKKGGIRVIMKTGDHKETALAIAREVNIVSKSNLALTGEELEAMDKKEFDRAIEKVDVFARLTPEMKLKILTVLQEKGHNVAVTGDGVNDVLALKKADIGIAMGKIGSDVARNASDIVLADDNFATLVDAIEEGRIVFTNTRQASAFLVTTNFAEDLIIISAILFGLPLPLLASQILWLNLVTGGLVDVALAAEPGHGNLLHQPPRQKAENILSSKMISFLTPIVLAMFFTSLWIFIRYLPQGIDKARTAAFCVMCFTQLTNIFNMRSLDLSLFKIGILTNKYIVGAVILSLILQFMVMSVPFFMDIFRFVPLSTFEVIKIGLLSLTVFVIGEGHKLARKKLFVS